METFFISAEKIFVSFHLNANSSDFEKFSGSVLQRGFRYKLSIRGAFGLVDRKINFYRGKMRFGIFCSQFIINCFAHGIFWQILSFEFSEVTPVIEVFKSRAFWSYKMIFPRRSISCSKFRIWNWKSFESSILKSFDVLKIYHRRLISAYKIVMSAIDFSSSLRKFVWIFLLTRTEPNVAHEFLWHFEHRF